MIVFGILMLIFLLACFWRIFEKAGRKGWESLVPFWGPVLFYSIAKTHWLWLCVVILCNIIIRTLDNSSSLGMLLCSIIPFAVQTYAFFNLARAFGKGIILSVFLSLFWIILLPVVAFDGSEYIFDED